MTSRVTQKKNLPRCPFCDHILEEVQLKLEEHPNNPGGPLVWHEVWNCDSCNTNHVFPARLEFLEFVSNSQILERSNRILHLPRSITPIKSRE